MRNSLKKVLEGFIWLMLTNPLLKQMGFKWRSWRHSPVDLRGTTGQGCMCSKPWDFSGVLWWKERDVGADWWILWPLPPSSYLTGNGHAVIVGLKTFTGLDQDREHKFSRSRHRWLWWLRERWQQCQFSLSPRVQSWAEKWRVHLKLQEKEWFKREENIIHRAIAFKIG